MTNDIGTVGFIGLGHMGGPMSGRAAAQGFSVIGQDAAGSAARAPEGVTAVDRIADLAGTTDIILLSLPDGAIVESVVGEIVGAPKRRVAVVCDHSTIGIAAAEKVARMLTAAGITPIDAPVSGGVAGARAGSLAMMPAGDVDTIARLDPLFASMAKKRFRVGGTPGQGQAMKVLNNFLSGIAITATSEAVAFGESQGLDPAMIIDVLNASTGRNTATTDKFPNRVLTGTFDAGFTIDLIAKDVRLYREAVGAAGTAGDLGAAVGDILEAMRAAMPGADFTRLYPFIKGGSGVA